MLKYIKSLSKTDRAFLIANIFLAACFLEVLVTVFIPGAIKGWDTATNPTPHYHLPVDQHNR